MTKKLALPVLALFLAALPAFAQTAPTAQIPVDPIVPTHDLSFGVQERGVAWLQSRLIDENAGPAAAALAKVGGTGYFGSLTRAALAEFQTKHGITPARGYFGPKTRAFFTAVPGNDSETFIGTLQSIDTSCFADGICSATFDGKKVVLLTGERPINGVMYKVGTISGGGVGSIGDLEAKVGSIVKVYAAHAEEEGYDYTLYGSIDYYLQVIAPAPKVGPITVRGTLGCLPALDPNKPHIMLCALGLKGDDGLYYGLDGQNPVLAETGKKVEVQGEFVTYSGPSVFERVGTIKIEKVTEL